MVVDDESDQILSIKLFFEHFGEFEVISAESGIECIDLLKKNIIPDLILMDIMMPKMSGWELFEQIKNNSKWKDIPVIVVTAVTGKDGVYSGKFVPDDYIEKPYDVEDLKKRVSNVLNKNR